MSILHKLYQVNPRKSSGRPHYRSFTDSLEAYERAAKKEYILLMRNFEQSGVYPDYHVVIGIHTPMPIKAFATIRKKAFERLKQWGVLAYYVHEPSKKSWLHIHALAIYDGDADDLRARIKEAFMIAGMDPTANCATLVLSL